MYLVRTNISHYIYRFIFNPFMHGLYGFFLFLAIDMLLKVYILFIDSEEVFTIEGQDVVLGLLGFFAFFIIKIFNNAHGQRRFD